MKLKQPGHWFDYVMLCIRLLWGVSRISGLSIGTGAAGLSMWLPIVLGFILSCTVPFALYLRKSPPYYAIAAELLITGSLFFLIPESEQTLIAFLQVPFFTIGYICIHTRLAIVTLAAIILITLFTGLVSNMEPAGLIDDTTTLLLLFLLGFFFQRLVRSYQKINEMYQINRQQHATLQSYADEIERLTIIEERNRVSRELHDTVGHTFTTTIIGMDAVMMQIDTAPQEAKKNLKELLHITRTGLDEVRAQIHAIAPPKETQQLAAILGQIGSQFEKHAGMNIIFEVSGDEQPVSESVRMLLIRCTQESLTNAKRHGEASMASIQLKYLDNHLKLRIHNNGDSPPQMIKGFGLESLEQRAANLNGRINIDSAPGKGLTITCIAPIMRDIRKSNWKGGQQP